MPEKTTPLKVGLICGGPSRERGISLNSARSVMDHLTRQEVALYPLYVDHDKNFYEVSKSQLYSNTPSDFDFKLAQNAKKIAPEDVHKTLQNLDIAFPVIHGAFGEDGELQTLLEESDTPFVGSGAQACRKMFHKYEAAKTLAQQGHEALPSVLLKQDDGANQASIKAFFKEHGLTRAIVKPVAGGSSIGVFNVTTPDETLEKLNLIFHMGIDTQAILEPFCHGKEFTVIVLQNPDGSPVALVPSEIQVSYEKGKIFDYRRKYLPTANTKWPCPPHFDDAIVAKIQTEAEAIFTEFGMADFARLDGWLMDDGRIVFTDLNPISGLEQNSFIFQQASRVGFTHRGILWRLLGQAAQRQGVKMPPVQQVQTTKKQKVHVLFGGATAERQVSLMSGTNVWLKLRQSEIYQPEPYFLDAKGHVWHLPYTYALNHTVEEVYENCLTAHAVAARLQALVAGVHKKLADAPTDYNVMAHIPEKLTFEAFLALSKQEDAFVFLGLHGGEGEDGTLQKRLDDEGLLYNGSGPAGAALCMDKYFTGEAILKLGNPDIITAPKKEVSPAQFEGFSLKDYAAFWANLTKTLGAETFIIKPRSDGCSAGIIRLYTPQDLEMYIKLVRAKTSYIEENTFKNQPSVIEITRGTGTQFIIESFIETDPISIVKNTLNYTRKTGWIELTVGVVSQGDVYHAFNPSITVAEGDVLSLEEKFQGGTGVNITPPPEEIISAAQGKKIKEAIEVIARSLGVSNYARLDIFFNVKTNKVLLIEVNTLPGLTGSTVIYHQALAENTPLTPLKFLEKIVADKKASVAPLKPQLHVVAQEEKIC